MLSALPIAQRRRRQRGSAIVESSLCFLAFIFLTLGLMEFSMAAYAFNFVTWVASDTARYASTHGDGVTPPATAADLIAYVRSQAVGLPANRISLENGDTPLTKIWPTNNHAGSVVRIKVKYDANPLIGVFLPDNMMISSTAKMVISK